MSDDNSNLDKNKYGIFKEELFRMYVEERKSQEKIAKHYGCSRGNIQGFLETYNITRPKIITKEILQKLYIDENKSQEQISEILGYERENIGYHLGRYGIKKDHDMIIKNQQETYFEKTGYKHQSQNPEVAEKIKEGNVKAWSELNSDGFPDLIEKRKLTNIDLFGCPCPLQNLDVKEKTKATNIKKWGTEHHFSNEDVKKGIRENRMKKTGYDHQMRNPEIKLKVKNKGIKKGYIYLHFGKTVGDWAEEYDVPQTPIRIILKEQPNITENEFMGFLNSYENNVSDIENIVSEKLNIDFYNKKFVSNLKYKPDFKLSNSLALNADGLYWHAEPNRTRLYHFNMRKNYESLGFRIFQFRANEIFKKINIIESMVNNSLNKTQNKIGARKTNIRILETDEAKLFLNQNHMKGYKDAKHVGLYFQDELVSLMSYKKFEDKEKKSFLKIERFCSKINYNVMGAFNKLLNYIKKEVGEMPIHYWVDLRYGTGNFLLSNGFRLEKETLGWEWTDYNNVYNRLKCRANMDERKLSEKEHAAELKWHKIHDAGQRLYIMN